MLMNRASHIFAVYLAFYQGIGFFVSNSQITGGFQ